LSDETDHFGTDLHEEHHDTDHDERDPARFEHRGSRLDNRQHAEECGDSVDDQHRLAVAEAQFAQAMVQVTFVRSKDRLLLKLAAHDREEGIRQRHPDNDQRRDERQYRDLLEPEQREHRQAEAQEQGTRIAHEDLGRVEVEEQEAYDASEQQQAKQRDQEVAVDQRHHEDGSDRDTRYAGGQAVKTVDQVDRVRHADDPEDGQRNRDPVFKRRISIHKRNIDEFDFDSESEDNDAGRADLDQELQFGIQVKSVIQRAGEHDNRSGCKEGLDKVPVAFRQVERKERHNGKKRNGKSEKNPESAESWHDARMHFAGVRHVHCSHLDRKPLHERRQTQSQSEREYET